ncbi:hypothetical protein [Acidovorax sp. K2F]|uniref:hypothetical protein n=1 Tax=Acidovorax sp. K2F TaxID=2978125 RepID=UPI0021B117F5|nr:hypothetical protein [Acidovorax sp. K2F]MCT6721709.1 hypothetical protein [Acidovorax sp. K2F]
MAFLAKVGVWVATNLPTFLKMTKGVAKFIHSAAEAGEALLEGREIVGTDAPISKKQAKPDTTGDRPDFLSAKKSQSDPVADLVARVDESKKQLAVIEHDNEIDHKRISLQIDVMELMISAQTFERFTNNINLHAANLQTHLYTIKNTAGLLDDVNRQRVAIKALMQTVNHMINVLNIEDDVQKISGIDINIRQGAISIADSYRAFEATKELLAAEIESYTKSIDEQLARADRVRQSARLVPSMSGNVSKWLENSVEPKLLAAKEAADELRGDVTMIPRIESTLRRELLKSDFLPPEEI